jgi:hypothetical protein
VARPKKEINYETVEKLANIQCTQEEIASFLGLSVRTLQRDEEFCRIYKKGQDNGKMSLRRMQYKLAEKNPSMAIWLGKQYLGQRDSFPDEVNYTEVNKGIMNIASLINNPVKNRTEKDVDEVQDK